HRHSRRAWPRRLPRRLAHGARGRMGRRSHSHPHQHRRRARPASTRAPVSRAGPRPHRCPSTRSRGDHAMTRCRFPRLAGASLLALTLAAPLTLSPVLTTPAHALFGFGRIVYDPTNHAENLLTAARTLEQINNQ